MDDCTILSVSGMMCEGCENRVVNVLSEIKEIKNVEASHKEGTVKIKHNGNVDIEEIKNSIEDLGYNVNEEK